MPKVLIADQLSPAAVAIFKDRGVEADMKTGLSKDELLKIIGEYDGLAVRSATKVNADVLKAAKNLKVIGRAGIGVDNIDVPAATAAGIIVMNTPFGNSITTAEHAIALMMAVARDIPAANTSTHAGKWEKNRFMGVELYGKTLGLIGCGNIGSIVADRAKGLKMRVVAFDPYLSPERATDLGVEKVELEDLLARADFISLHTPLTNETKNIISADAIAKMKKGARLINCARGGLVDETAVKAALDSGQLAGAAFDVFAEEPAKSNVLFGNERVVVDAASRRFDQRSAGECRASGGRADFGLSADGCGDERAQHALDLGRGSAARAAVDLARRKARRVRGPAHRDEHLGSRDRLRGHAPRS